MATIKISHPNPLSVEEAKKRVTDIFNAASAKFSLKQSWEGDKLIMSGSGIDGHAEVTAKSVEVEVKLGFATSMFKGKIESGIREELEKNIKA